VPLSYPPLHHGTTCAPAWVGSGFSGCCHPLVRRRGQACFALATSGQYLPGTPVVLCHFALTHCLACGQLEACAACGPEHLCAGRQQDHSYAAVTGGCIRVPSFLARLGRSVADSRRGRRPRERRFGDASSIGRRRPSEGETRAAPRRILAVPFFVPDYGPDNGTNGKYTHCGCTFRLSYFSARMLGPDAVP